MKSKYFLIFFSVLISISTFGQKNKISFDIGYGLNLTQMRDLNQFFIDSFAAKPQINLLNHHFNKSQQFRLGLNYQPNGQVELGIYGGYQFESQQTKQTISSAYPIIEEAGGTYTLRVEAITTGIHATWYFSELIGLQKKENALNRLHLGLDINGGIGFSKATIDGLFPEIEKQTPYIAFRQFKDSHSFQGQLGVKVEYDLSKQPFFTTLGIRLGYQYFKTKTLKDRVGDDWTVLTGTPMNLDFSGFYFGAYLKIGK